MCSNGVPIGRPEGHYLLREYTRASIEGSGTFGPASQSGTRGGRWAPGTYEIRLFLDDGYRVARRVTALPDRAALGALDQSSGGRFRGLQERSRGSTLDLPQLQ
jgi:hypothetical protein